MAPLTADPHYQQSAHVNNAAGVRPSCGSCHIPTNNWFVETYTHISSGIRDVISEATTNFDDREAWNAHRRELAKGVHEKMRAQGNVTCKSCHTPASIKPASQTGQVVHASMPDDVACVSCHRNLVHARPASLSAAEEITKIKRATEDWVHSRHLSNIHAQKSVSCSGCHGNDLIPDANATAPNGQCVTCHGGMEQIAQNFKGPIVPQSARIPSRRYPVRLVSHGAPGIEAVLPELSHQLQHADPRRGCYRRSSQTLIRVRRSQT